MAYIYNIINIRASSKAIYVTISVNITNFNE